MNAKRLLGGIVTVGLGLSVGSSVLAKEKTAPAMAPWHGSGEVFVVAPGTLVIQSSFSGILYVQGEPGPLDGAVMLCPVMQTLDVKARRAEARGHCTFADADNDAIYSTLTCTGGQGTCEGEITFTGGTGKFAGITGGGKLTVRAALAETAAGLSDSGGLVRGSTGLIIWPELKYSLPAR